MKKKLSLLLMLLMVMTVTTVHAQRLMQTLGRGVVVASGSRTGEVECLCERNENQHGSCHEYQYADCRFETARW